MLPPNSLTHLFLKCHDRDCHQSQRFHSLRQTTLWWRQRNDYHIATKLTRDLSASSLRCFMLNRVLSPHKITALKLPDNIVNIIPLRTIKHMRSPKSTRLMEMA
jgi:hypothetical protein